ncbi:MAG TPA: hypothetical protein PKZ77_01940 [Pseudomonadales bacterium]|nr:hypothetical protein [Pseudomonadales bacterium]HNC69226.1 hypothetical protein [Pseudomonadales bacterium]
MITAMDEYLIHQTEQPLALTVSREPHWDDSAYFFMHDRNGEMVAFVTFEVFPNRGHARALMLACHQGQHSRYVWNGPLDNDNRLRMRGGGIEFVVVEPQRVWALGIDDPANGIHAELRFTARCVQNVVRPPFWLNAAGRPVIQQQHYNQSGEFRGEFRIGGACYRSLLGMRNRSWGVRAWLELPMYHWCEAQFEDFAINTWKFENQDGSSVYTDGAITHADGRIERIVRYEQRIETFTDSGVKRPRLRHCRIETETGRVVDYSAHTVHSMVLGPTPDRWSEQTPVEQRYADEVALWYEQLVRVEFAGQTGYGMFEVFVSPGSQVHGIPPTPFPEAMLTTHAD